jgi:hypothetical protein
LLFGGQTKDFEVRGESLYLDREADRDAQVLCPFEFVYESSSTAEDIYSRSVKPLIHEQLLKGYSVCLLVLGSSKSKKKDTLKRCDRMACTVSGLVSSDSDGLLCCALL